MTSNPIKIPRCCRMAWISESLFFEFLWHARDPELSWKSQERNMMVCDWICTPWARRKCLAGIAWLNNLYHMSVHKCRAQMYSAVSSEFVMATWLWCGCGCRTGCTTSCKCDQGRSKWGSLARDGTGDNGALGEFQAKNISSRWKFQ